MIGQNYRSTWKNYTRPNFTKSQTQQVKNKEKSIDVVQAKTYIRSNISYISAKSPTKQLLLQSVDQKPSD